MNTLTVVPFTSETESREYFCPAVGCPGAEADDLHGHYDPRMQWIWSRFDPYGPLPEEGTLAYGSGRCWCWLGSTISGGYPNLWMPGGNQYVYRMIVEHIHGPIPDGWQVDHRCHRRDCVNPMHLEAVPPEVNSSRSWDHHRYRTDHGLGPVTKRCSDVPGYYEEDLLACS